MRWTEMSGESGLDCSAGILSSRHTRASASSPSTVVCCGDAKGQGPQCWAVRSWYDTYYIRMTANTRSVSALELSGDGLTLDDAERVLRGHVERLTLTPAARKRVERARRCLEQLMARGGTIYGVNT